MSGICITYATVYGSAKEYAEELARRLGLIAADVSSADLSGSEAVVHFGSLYAGSMLGLKTAVRKMPENALLLAVSVGLADPNANNNKEKICRDINKAVPESRRRNATFFHLRGRMDYSLLSPRHRAMMWMLCKWINKKDTRSDEDQAILDTYGTCIDFMDISSVGEIEEYIRKNLTF